MRCPPEWPLRSIPTGTYRFKSPLSNCRGSASLQTTESSNPDPKIFFAIMPHEAASNNLLALTLTLSRERERETICALENLFRIRANCR